MNKNISFAFTVMCLAVAPMQTIAQTTIHEDLPNSTTSCIEEKHTESGNTYINPSLQDLLHHEDYDRLVMPKEKALKLLEALDNNAYGINERKTVSALLTASEQTFSLQDLSAYRKVRSIQVNSDGIFSYPYFSCHFKEKDGQTFFEKVTGSQRKSGYIYDNDSTSKIFLGGWSVNNDPQTTYSDSLHSEAGTLYKIGKKKMIMLFVVPDKKFEIYEIIIP
ncbi:MAG: DUF4893 domain-containing protein [Bacteroides sp.]|nr:DUF4893 domain-containing protein [Roseburia sp.]MCM1345958.1 DUF4893 domain-containing protein [Bacteroides sp.]MCM1420322.1 DUF4893 domain-containing protein [Bacteroides sp.]